MSITPQEMCKCLKESIEKLDLDAAIVVLEKMGSDDVAAVLHEKMEQPGAYQIRGNRIKRNAFFDGLLNSLVMSSEHNSIHPYVNEINEKIKKIETCFDEIRDSLPKCDISQFSGNIQFWSHIERAAHEFSLIDDAVNKEREKIEAKFKNGEPIAIPEMFLVKLNENDRAISAEIAYSNIIDSLSLTLKMISFEQKLLHKGKLIAPTKIMITDEHIYKAGSIQLYATSWNALENAANRILFFGGKVVNVQDSTVSVDHFSAEFRIKFPSPIVFSREQTDAEVYDFMANRRLLTWMHQNAMLMMNRVELRRAVMKEDSEVPEIAKGFISENEGITLMLLSEILAYDIFDDTERFHGLTLQEWVRGYCALGLMAETKQKDSCLVTFERREIEQGLLGYKLPEECIHFFIYHLTFGQDSRDLYDSPLICSKDDKYTLFANVVKTSNIINVLFSRLSSLSTQFDKKGKGFEDSVVSSFIEWGYLCKPTKFKIGNDEYEYDALVLIDDTLLLIECKNNLLSSNSTVQAFRYSESIEDNIKQIKRLECGLRARPEVVESLFNRKLDDLTLKLVLLNSMTYSRSPVDDVYISDWSALSKFFTESTISRFGLQNGKKVNKKTIHTLWKGKRPTAKELLDYLEMPIQLKLMSKHLCCKYVGHPMSESSIFFAPELDFDENEMFKARGNPLPKKGRKKKAKIRRKKR